MRITALAVDGNRRRPDVRCDALDAGLNVLHGPVGSAKTTVADLVAHTVFGRRLPPSPAAGDELRRRPEGEVLIESGGRALRLRRCHDRNHRDRLTVAAVDSTAVDRDTVRQLAHGLPTELIGTLFVCDFRDPERLAGLLTEEFAQQFRAAVGEPPVAGARPSPSHLLRRRDALAQELETQIAERRQQSQACDARWHQLDRQFRQVQQQHEQRRDRLRAVEAELVEIESWLRCQQAAAAGPRPSAPDSADRPSPQTELDTQIAHWRTVLAEMDRRLADVRSQQSQVQPPEASFEVVLTDQRDGLAAMRKLVDALQEEVARLARAAASHACICGDSHPRLRPVVATLAASLDRLDLLSQRQADAIRASQLDAEASHLARSRSALRGQLEHLLQRRESLGESARGPAAWTVPNRAAVQAVVAAGNSGNGSAPRPEGSERHAPRRLELLEQRGVLHDELATLEPELHRLRTERDAVDGRRTEALSHRAIGELEQQLADAQQALEQAARLAPRHDVADDRAAGVRRASDYLAAISNGELIELRLPRDRQGASVVARSGEARRIEALAPAELDQVCIGLRLALAAACGQRGIRLPLVLDEPFARLAGPAIGALATVLDDFARGGHQVLALTSVAAAIERLASRGAVLYHLANRPWRLVPDSTDDHPPAPRSEPPGGPAPQRSNGVRRTTRTKRSPKKRRREAG